MSRGAHDVGGGMRIVVYPATMEMGGSTMNALELAARVQARGHEVIVYGDDDVLVGVARSLGLEFQVRHAGRGWPSFRDVLRLHRLVRRRGIQIVHAYEGGPALDVAFLESLSSRVVPMTTVMSMTVPYELPRHSDLFVGTRELREHAARTRARVHLMEPPIDVDANRRTDPDGARTRMGIGDEMTCLSIVCRLTEDLGKLPGVLEAIATVDGLAVRHSLQLLVAGGGEGLAAVRTAADRVNAHHGRQVVIVTGPLLDPRDAYDATDIALGMGSSALKALSFGTPLVVQGGHGFWKLFDQGSRAQFAHTGFYGDGGNGSADLADILTSLIEDRAGWPELGAMGREFVEASFSLDAATDVLVEAYERALETPHRRPVVWRELGYTVKELVKFRVATWDERRWDGRIRATTRRLRMVARRQVQECST